MGIEGRFCARSQRFSACRRAHTRSGLRRPWHRSPTSLRSDPDGTACAALSTTTTWPDHRELSPADGGEHLPVELAGPPVLRPRAQFRGLQGLCVCPRSRRLNRLDVAPPLRAAHRAARASNGLSAECGQPYPDRRRPPPPISRRRPHLSLNWPAPLADANFTASQSGTSVETPPNVVTVPPGGSQSQGDQRSPSDQRFADADAWSKNMVARSTAPPGNLSSGSNSSGKRSRPTCPAASDRESKLTVLP